MARSPMTTTPYGARRVSLLEQWAPGEWRIKVYGIAWKQTAPDAKLVQSAKTAALRLLPAPACGDGRYGVGFMGVHQGRGSNLVFLDWWADENELHHHVLVSEPEAPTALRDVTGTGLIACVWDLAVIGFERQAWITAALSGGEPDVESYLAFRLEGAL
jgi:hypothetical protein